MMRSYLPINRAIQVIAVAIALLLTGVAISATIGPDINERLLRDIAITAVLAAAAFLTVKFTVRLFTTKRANFEER